MVFALFGDVPEAPYYWLWRQWRMRGCRARRREARDLSWLVGHLRRHEPLRHVTDRQLYLIVKQITEEVRV